MFTKTKLLLLAALTAILPVSAFATAGNTHNLQNLQVQGLGRVKITGSFAPNGSSAVSAASTNGVGFTVARASVGTYTITFSDSYSALVDVVGSVQESAHGSTHVEFGPYSATNKTLTVYTWQRQLGTVDLPIAAARILATNDVQNTAAIGGIVTKNTAPLLQAVNPGTDQSLVLQWAAAGVAKVAWQVAVPADIDGTVAPVLNAYAKMGGATDTPTLTFQAFQLAGSDLGGATGALSSTVGKVSVTLSAGVSYPGNLGVTLVPGTHGTDAASLYAAWLEYTKKDLVDLAANANNRVHFEVMFKNGSFGSAGTGAH